MKGKRQERILELIRDSIILTQEELQSALTANGFRVTQSTVSRDIKELRLVKGHDADGNYRYISTGSPSPDQQPLSHYRELFSKSALGAECAMNNIVVKCYNGMASSACVAIDALFGERMLGSLAGDDTVFIVTSGTQEAILLTNELNKLI